MKLGWIDFSNADRDKTLDVLRLLEEKQAIDELGIGVIRDGFADIFFPGTSTVQTKGKYFFITPYILRDIVEKSKETDLKRIKDLIDKKEFECGRVLYENTKDKDGVIGRRGLPNRWVKKPPSVIYWNGLKELGFVNKVYTECSINDYIKMAIVRKKDNDSSKLGNASDEKEDNVADDKDTQRATKLHFWNIPNYDKNWIKNLSINLSKEEAKFLKERICSSVKDSLFAYILANNVKMAEYDDFAALSAAVSNGVPPELGKLLDMANRFNYLYYLARLRYNIMLQDDEGAEIGIKEEWDNRNLGMLPSQEDLQAINNLLRIRNGNLVIFLKKLLAAILENDVLKADQLIRQQEKQIKRERSKLDKTEYRNQGFIGQHLLNYRFYIAKTIVGDIYAGEKV